MNAKEKMQAILDYLGMKPAEFARSLGLSRADTISDPLNGKVKKISKRTAAIITSAYPSFNEKWLLEDEGEMLLSDVPEELRRNKVPQVVPSEKSDVVIAAINRLSTQIASMNKTINELTGINNDLQEQLKQKDVVIQEDIHRLSFAFDRLASSFRVDDARPPKKEWGNQSSTSTENII